MSRFPTATWSAMGFQISSPASQPVAEPCLWAGGNVKFASLRKLPRCVRPSPQKASSKCPRRSAWKWTELIAPRQKARAGGIVRTASHPRSLRPQTGIERPRKMSYVNQYLEEAIAIVRQLDQGAIERMAELFRDVRG